MSLLRNAGKAVFAGADLLLPTPDGPRILIYHQIGDESHRQTEVRRDIFEWQIKWLLANRRIVTLETAIGRWDEAGAGELAVLTFDDGYRDTYTNAFPMLRELELPFTIYLATHGIGREAPSGSETLAWGQLEDMMSSGLLTVGAHTHGHTDLRTVSEDRVIYELETSNALIESRLGVRPEHFAYPWGYWAKPADHSVRRTYSSAVLGAPPVRRKGTFDPHMIYRFPVQASDGRSWFRPRLGGGLLLEEEVRRRLRGYHGP